MRFHEFFFQGDVLVATSSWVAGASAKNPVAANKIENMNEVGEGEIGSSLKNVVHFYMMDIKEVDNATFNLSGDPGCFTRWDYSRYFEVQFIFRFDL